MTHSPGILYRVYLNEEWDLAEVYGFRRKTCDGRKFHTRYLTENGIEEYTADLWLLGVTEIEFEEIDAEA